MSFGPKFWILVGGAAAAGAGTGIVLLHTRELTLASTRDPEAFPALPGQGLPALQERGWEHPSENTPEGRLIRQILAAPQEHGRDRLLAILVHPHPAVRETVLRQLARQQKGTTDPLTVKALLSRLENERDPVVRSAAKSALKEVTGTDQGDGAEAWKSWWTAREKGL